MSELVAPGSRVDDASELVAPGSPVDDASDVVALEGGANAVIARRAGRIAFGIVLVAGMFALVAYSFHDEVRGRGPIHAWHIIVATWLAALFGAAIVTAAVGSTSRSRNHDDLRRPALWVPAVGIALLLPLTLHLPFMLGESADVFDDWARMSVLLVGPTHLVFAVLVFARAQALTSDRTVRKPLRIRTIYLVTVAVAAFPYVIPALFVAVTGLPIIALLRRMEAIAHRDREDSRDVPFAIVRSR